MRRGLLIHLLLLAAAASGGACGLAAQRSPAAPGLEEGARVRVFAPAVTARPLVGRLLRLSPDSLALQSGDGVVTVAIAEAERIQRSLGRSHSQGLVRGLGYGAILGGATVGALVASGADVCIYINCLRRDFAGVAGGFLAGAVLGAPAGGIVGGVVGVEQWHRVRQVTIGLYISPAAVAIQLRVP